MHSEELLIAQPTSTLPRSPGDGTQPPVGLAGVEVVAVVALLLLAAPIIVAYLVERSGAAMSPAVILPLSVGAAAAMVVWLSRGARWHAGEVASFVVVVGLVLAWLLWLAWPALLPLGGSRHCPSSAAHRLHRATLALVTTRRSRPTLGRWSLLRRAVTCSRRWPARGPDRRAARRLSGCRLVSGHQGRVLFLIARRLIPEALPRIRWHSRPYCSCRTRIPTSLARSRDSFLAQVIAELFTIVMWWALVVWDERPMIRPMVLYAIAGVAVFLTWPVWIGPPLLVLPLLVWLRRELSVRERLAYLILGGAPIAAVAALYIAGRLAWVGYVRAGGAVVQPSTSEFGWVFPIVAAIGLGLLLAPPRGRASVLVAAIGLQALALFKLNEGHSQGASYIFKMVYLASPRWP